MARLIFGMNQSLDGYVDHTAFAPGPRLFDHFIEQTRQRAAAIYGRRMYEIMRYWDEQQDGWDASETAFAQAWRAQQKWVVTSGLTAFGPNARSVDGDLAVAVERIKRDAPADIEVAGPTLAQALDAMGLVDEFQIYLHPVVAGGGTPFFAAARPRLHLVAAEPFPEDVVRLVYRTTPSA